MNFKRLAILPFLVGLVPALIMLGIEVARTRQIALRIEIETVKMLGLVGSVIAARSFERGRILAPRLAPQRLVLRVSSPARSALRRLAGTR